MKDKKDKKKGKGPKSDEKIIKEVIRKYGDVINLRDTPYVLIEILRGFGGRIQSPDGGLPPGGTGPTGPASSRVDNAAILKEILKVGREVKAIRERLG